MKVRQGFVSNSSTTSFCIYGIYVDGDQETLEDLDDTANKLHLFVQYGPDEGIYIGREFATIGDNETGEQFKKKTQELINRLPVKDSVCSIINEGWRDG